MCNRTNSGLADDAVDKSKGPSSAVGSDPVLNNNNKKDNLITNGCFDWSMDILIHIHVDIWWIFEDGDLKGGFTEALFTLGKSIQLERDSGCITIYPVFFQPSNYDSFAPSLFFFRPTKE